MTASYNGANILDLDWEEFIETKPATESTIRCPACGFSLAEHDQTGTHCSVLPRAGFDPYEIPTRPSIPALRATDKA